MFIYTAKAPKRRSLLLLAALALLLFVSLLLLRGCKPAKQDDTPSLEAATNEERVAYLHSLGWEVDEEPLEALRLTLPKEMAEPYRSYNELQLQQGFDLTPCLGKTLERYTYRVTNYPGHPKGSQADLYICDGVIVAGDIICTGANGFIDTLDFPAASNHNK